MALIGYRGTGKSTVARLLGQALSRPVVDADVELTRRAGKSIREIFVEAGEPAFRRLETEVLQELLAREPSIIATGGGVVLSAENRSCLAQQARTVWLRASAATIVARLEADQTTDAMRPPLSSAATVSAEVVELLRTREPLYRSTADAVVDTDERPPAAVAAEVLSRLGLSSSSRLDTDVGESA